MAADLAAFRGAAGGIAGAMLGTLIALVGFAAVTFVQGVPGATAEAQVFASLRSEGASMSDLCRQARQTRIAFAKEGDPVALQHWTKTESDACIASR